MVLNDAGIYDMINIFTGEATKHASTSRGGIINNNARLINIPAYQRPYRWTNTYIDKLFQDFEDNTAESEYFLGSAVLVEKGNNGKNLEYDVVDGQQRLTTLYLLNYIRFLLRRQYIFDELNGGHLLKGYYSQKN